MISPSLSFWFFTDTVIAVISLFEFVIDFLVIDVIAVIDSMALFVFVGVFVTDDANTLLNSCY